MTYEQKYKEAFERARELNDGKDVDVEAGTTTCEYIFPELKESEDERMKKAIMHVLYENYTDAAVIEGVEIAEIVAWLEKQGEKSQGKSALEAIKEEKVDNQNCVKSADKVEPKFKAGDYIVPDNITSLKIWKVINIDEDGYYSIMSITNPEYDEIYYVPAFFLERDYRLWTIQDAKDGDILCYETDELEWILIFKDIIPASSVVPHDSLRYHALLSGDVLSDSGIRAMVSDDADYYFRPATKEERDLLFQKMREVNTEWDAEKFYCEFRDCDVTYRKICKNCIVASFYPVGNFYCPYYKK